MPSVADRLNAALERHRAGQLAEAESAYRQVLADAPQSADAWHLLGAVCLQAHRPAEAVEAIGKAIKLSANNPEYYSHLGAAYGELGQHDDAIASLRYAVRLAPQSSAAHYNLGTALRNAEQLEAAVASFRHAVAAEPDYAEAHYNLANALRELYRLEEAEASYRQALRVRPRYVKALINLGNVLTDRKRFDEAVDVLRAAVEIEPNYARAYVNLGSALRDARRFDEAIAELERAVELDPQSAEARNALGTVLQSRAQFDEAWDSYERALILDPELADAHFSLGTQLLRQGELARGFAEYDWRWKCKSFSTRSFKQTRWDGEPLAGRTILLHAEQGLGDTLQFVRYAADVQRQGGRVIFECQETIIPLLRSCAGIDHLVAAGKPLPAFDVQCPLLSLPGVLGLSIDELARGEYLTADPERVATWRDQLAPIEGFRVGIAWQGNPQHLFDHQRSFPLVQLAPLAAIEGVRLVSLQKGFGAEQIAGCGFEVIELGNQLDVDGAFLDTAAVMRNLDLVVSCDSAAVHLAGALGVPVWVALSEQSDWRWFIDRPDSPWYPTARLFRQSRLYQWSDVIERLSTELRELVAAARAAEKR